MKRTVRKLQLSTTTVRDLTRAELERVGGADRPMSALSECLRPSWCNCPTNVDCSIIGSGCISCFTCAQHTC